MMGLLSHLSQLATGSLVSAVWQGILLIVVTGFALRLLPKTPPAVRFAIWFAVFVVVTALPLASLWPRAAEVGGHAWITVDERWCVAIAAVWALASAVRAATLVAAGLRVRALWKRARAVAGASENWAGATTGILRSAQNDNSIGGRRAQVCVSDEVDRPTVIGFLAPKILIPAWLLEKLTPAELEQIVLHEAGHLGRADDWMNLLQKVALVIFPLNPALAWVERRLCFERELAVDERVLRAFAGTPGAAKAYAACLATLAEYRLGRKAMALALGALGRESELGRRVGRILQRGESMRPLHAKLVLGGAMLGLAVGAAGLARCPQFVAFTSRSEATVASSQFPGSRYQVGALTDVSTRAINAVYKMPVNSVILPISHAGRAVMSGAVQPDESADGRKSDIVSRPASDGMRVVQTTAQIPSRKPAPLVSDAEPVAAPRYAVQMVTLTAWQSADGMRVVMATTRTVLTDQPASTASEQDAPSSSPAPAPVEDGTSQQQEPQALPYAVVPVRGGWLAFQL